MSHRAFASVWVGLQGRLDIDNIVNELIGTHALQKSDDAVGNPERLRQLALDLVVALRTIFDLQRTYLQASEPSFEAQASLLSADLLRRAISYLINIKATVITLSNEHPSHKEDCDLLAHALLSGLRALLLRKQTLAAPEHRRLVISFNEAWVDEELDDSCHFVVKWLCERIIHQLGTPLQNDQCIYPAYGTADLQDYFDGLYPIEKEEHALGIATQQVTPVPDWFRKVLVLYDLCWSTTAALIQLCVDVQTTLALSDWTRNNEVVRNSDLNEILTTRFRILRQIYMNNMGGNTGEDHWCNEQIRHLLVFGLQRKCIQSECDCSNYQASRTPCPILSAEERVLGETIQTYSPRHRLFNETEQSLRRFSKTLEARNSALLDCNGELAMIAHSLNQYLQDWCSQSVPNKLNTDAKDTPPAEDTYVMSCPQLHPVSANSLIDLTIHSDGTDKPDPSALPSVILSHPNIKCQICLFESQPISARKIEPLSMVSQQLQERLRLYQEFAEAKTGQSQPSIQQFASKQRSKRRPTLSFMRSASPTPSNAIVAMPPSGFSPPLSQSTPILTTPGVNSQFQTPISSPLAQDHAFIGRTRSTQAPERISHIPDLPEVVSDPPSHMSDSQSISSGRAGYSPSVFSQPSPATKKFGVLSSIFKSDKAAVSLPFAAFFASGKRLALWNDRGAGCYNLDDPERFTFQPWNTSIGVLMAAGGTVKSAVISRVNANTVLSVFQADKSHPTTTWRIEAAPYSLAVSRNDQFVALKFSRTVQIYETSSGEIFKHDLPAMKAKAGKGNHLVSFSLDSDSFITSTRYEPERVLTHWSLCKQPNVNNKIETHAPYGHVNDGGLSSLIYADTKREVAMVTTFTEKGYPTILRLSSPPNPQLLPDIKSRIGSRVHKSAICPEGDNIALITQSNEIHWMQNAFGRGSSMEQVARIKRRNSVLREVELAMPRRDELHIFWIDKEKARGTLVTVGRSGGKSNPAHLTVDMNTLLT
ncbi:MAG: hypothetical protein M1814_000635 [Vezdaea aestivalis]|nr:MAG: hypothetical protein M1814_000635 [Vezdaea aestivalis]